MVLGVSPLRRWSPEFIPDPALAMRLVHILLLGLSLAAERMRSNDTLFRGRRGSSSMQILGKATCTKIQRFECLERRKVFVQ